MASDALKLKLLREDSEQNPLRNFLEKLASLKKTFNDNFKLLTDGKYSLRLSVFIV